MARKERRRLQVEFTPEAYERLVKLREAADKSTDAELIRDALRVYEQVVEHCGDRCLVKLERDGTERLVELII